ncbi:MAG: sigma-70 family RNA polymerase sigma factor [Prevotella sp.]|nr:sigma-70 family RNA polymerase sigma factor [Prevotella sp.]
MHNDFIQLATAIRPRLISLCRSFFDRQELACDAEDAVQETLLRLWLMHERLRMYHSPETLAIKIAKNVCIDMLKKACSQHEPLEDGIVVFAPLQTDHQAILHDTERIIGQAMKKLPGTQCRMLVMRSEGMTMEEIAAACGTTPASVKTMVCTARKQLMTTINIRRK